MTVIEELVADYDPTQVAQRVTRRRRVLTSRLISLVITVGLLIGLYFWQRSEGQPVSIWVAVVVIAITLAWTAATALLYLRSKRELRALPTGPAVRIGRAGVEVAGLQAGWSDVARLGAVKGGLGRSPRLELRTQAGATASVPFEQVGVRPATLDTTARAYSAGRHGVDLEALEV